MSKITVIAPHGSSWKGESRLETLLHDILPKEVDWIYEAESLTALHDKKILFAITLDGDGMNDELDRLRRKMTANKTLFKGCTAAIAVDGEGDLFTKSIAREVVFRANRCGCEFLPKPLIEATGNLYNFELRASLLNDDLMSAYRHHLRDLINRLTEDEPMVLHKPAKLLTICSTNRMATANSVSFGKMVLNNLDEVLSHELINIGKDQIYDCHACTWNACTDRGCPKPDLLRDEVFAKIEASDAVLLLAPNLNDSIGADLAALVNRLTHMANLGRIHGQYIYAVIVSGYSGGDLLARQILNGLCLNKGFRLPPYFAAFETANRPLSILEDEQVRYRAEVYAQHIRKTLGLVCEER